MLCNVLARCVAVDCVNRSNGVYHRIDIWYKEPGLPFYNELGRGSPVKRNDRATHRHCFDHHHAKWLFPLNRIEEGARATKKAGLLLYIHRTDIADLLIVDLRFDLLREVMQRFWQMAIHRSCQNKLYSCLFCGLYSQV